MGRRDAAMSFSRWFRPRKMLVLVLGTMVVFAGTAAWFVWRLAEQDRTLGDQQIRERLESAADLIAAELRQGLAGLEGRIEALSALAVDERPAAAARAAGQLADDALIVLAGPAGLSAYPPGRVVYYPTLSAPLLLPPDTFAEGEAFEFRTRQYDRAIAIFRRQAASDDALIRAGALLRLARVQRKAGHTQEALATYDELVILGGILVNGLPAELLARHARCAVLASESRLTQLRSETAQLQKQLWSGAWTIDRGTFLHYTAEAETFLRLATGGDEVPRPGGSGAAGRYAAPAEARLKKALALATGLEVMWQEWHQTSGARDTLAERVGDEINGRISRELEGTWMLLLWRGTGDTAVGLVGGPGLLWQELIAPLEPLLGRQAAALLIGDGAGHTMVRAGFLEELAPGAELQGAGSEAMGAVGSQAPRARRTLAESGLPWELQIVSADPSAERARFVGRQRLLLTVSGLVVLLVAAAAYFSSRAVARELAVARLQSEFVSAVSHDFRTPLTSLRQVTEALAGDRVAAERRSAYYGIQLRAIDRLRRMVEGLLDFGRIEAGGREFEQRPIQVRAWVEGVVRTFQAEVDKQGYAIELSWSGADPVIEGDEPALTRALWNLLDNAVKYSPDCKTVWVDGRIGGAASSTAASGRAGTVATGGASSSACGIAVWVSIRPSAARSSASSCVARRRRGAPPREPVSAWPWWSTSCTRTEVQSRLRGRPATAAPSAFACRSEHDQDPDRRGRPRHRGPARGRSQARGLPGRSGRGWRNGAATSRRGPVRSAAAGCHVAGHGRVRSLPSGAACRLAVADRLTDRQGAGGRSGDGTRPRGGRLRH